MGLLYFLQPLLLYLALFLFIRHRRKEMDKDVRKAEWERDVELGRMSPGERVSAVARRFGWIMRIGCAAPCYLQYGGAGVGRVVFLLLTVACRRISTHFLCLDNSSHQLGDQTRHTARSGSPRSPHLQGVCLGVCGALARPGFCHGGCRRGSAHFPEARVTATYGRLLGRSWSGDCHAPALGNLWS